MTYVSKFVCALPWHVNDLRQHNHPAKTSAMGKMRIDRKRPHHTASEGVRQAIVFNKEFGQHILKNPLVTTAIVDKVC